MQKVAQIVTDQIIEALESGTAPWVKPWRTSAPKNYVSKKAYRGINPILLSLYPFSSPYWLTFNQAKEKGGTVRKGSKGAMVAFWKFDDKKTSDDEDDVPTKSAPILRYYNVFNTEQCDGLPAIETVEEATPINPIEAAERLLNESAPRRAPIIHEGQRAAYSPSNDQIIIPPFDTFKSAEGYYGTAYHEAAHSTGHALRLKRDGILEMNGFGSESYSKEELIAEMTSAFLCAHVGIDNTLNNSASYVASWLRALKSGNNRMWIISAAGAAQKAFDYLTFSDA